MADKIKYICLSDLHLGEEDSLLTAFDLPGKPCFTKNSHLMIHLIICLRHLIGKYNKGEKPALVLNGDILELALSRMNEAAMVFKLFIDYAMLDGNELFDRVIYIPGNHDHHLWETARESQFADYLTYLAPQENEIASPKHTTDMIKQQLSDYPPAFLRR